MPYRSSQNHEIERVMSFSCLNVFKLNEHTEDFHLRKPNHEKFLFEIEVEKYINVGEKVFTFDTNDKKVKYSLDLGSNDIKFPFAYGEENIYFMFRQKYIPILEHENSTGKNEYHYFFEKMVN